MVSLVDVCLEYLLSQFAVVRVLDEREHARLVNREHPLPLMPALFGRLCGAGNDILRESRQVLFLFDHQAKLPAGSCFYSLRHWYISQALLAGVDIELLARNVGNSAQIIRKHYHKFLQDDVREQINKLRVTV